MTKSLSGKVALITGASRGIGFAIAKKLIEEGAQVIVIARTIKALEELDDYANSLGSKITIVPLDLTDMEKIDLLAPELFKKFGKIDLFVSSAVIPGEPSPITHTSPRIFERAITTNLTANFRLIRALDPLFRAASAAKLFFLTDKFAADLPSYAASYAVSKMALEALVEIYKKESKVYGIEVNLIALDAVNTKLREHFFPGEDKSKILQPQAIAEYLFSKELKEDERIA